ncbi:MAG: glycosyltransferase, partial [Verrucomicrobiota bacterium]|nr:glycosyltransferase [Verrucomicrobiota bacterium]
QLAKTHPRIHYEIVGDGPLRGELSALIDSLGVRDKIVLTGWRTGEDISRILDDADILVAPSVTATNGDQEGIPVTIMEAMSTGLPVVSTWHSGIPELVRDRVSGLLAPERDVAALTSHLLALIERPELRREMGAAGSAIVQANYNIDALNDRLETIFRTFAADSRDENPTGDEKF